MKKEFNVSRRSFVKGGALGLAGLTTAGALSGAAVTAVAEPAPELDTLDLIPQAYLNPQDYSYMEDSGDYSAFFEPYKVATFELPNRIVKSAAGSATYLSGGKTQEMFDYYVNFAKGGVPLIYVEGVAWLGPDGGTTTTGAETTPEEAADYAKRLVAACAEYGTILGYQGCAFSPAPVGDLTVEQIQELEDGLVTKAKWYYEQGFRAWEFHVTGGCLATSLLTRAKNTRTDEYGGSIENRARFICETVSKVRAAVGDDFIIQILLEAVNENDNITNNNGSSFLTLDKDVTYPNTRTLKVEEGIAAAKLFEAAGASAIHLRLGMTDYHPAQFGSDLYFSLYGLEGFNAYGWQWDFSRHFEGLIDGAHSGAGMLLNIAKLYKEQLSIPVGCVTYMDPAHAPDFFANAIKEDKVDYYEMNRPLTVDPEYVNKLREGRIDEIAPCCRCLSCHIGSNESNRKMGYCRVNALTQRVFTENGPANYELPMAETPKKVMVIGGGPTGMEAARVAAMRGHQVTLFEKEEALGGKLDFAALIKGPHENLAQLKKYLARQLEVNGVEVVLGTEVTADTIAEFAPDAVVLACGGVYDTLEVEGDGSVPVIDYKDFAAADGKNIIVYGYNAQAFDAALWLTVRKHKVTIITPATSEELDMQQSQHAKRFMTSAFYALGVEIWPDSELKSIADGTVTFAAANDNFDKTIPCDAIINAKDLLPNTALIDGLDIETYAVGDCAVPFNIGKAIIAGNDAARAL